MKMRPFTVNTLNKCFIHHINTTVLITKDEPKIPMPQTIKTVMRKSAFYRLLFEFFLAINNG